MTGNGQGGDAGLGELIEGFLAADGYAVERPAAHCFAGVREEAGSPTQRRYVWFTDPVAGVVPDADGLLADFAAAREQLDASSQAFFVTPSLEGIGTAFRQQAAASGIGVRVPVQFFDTPYKADDDGAFGAGRGREARSVFDAFVREHRNLDKARVPQPFEALSALGGAVGGFAAGEDLLAHLAAEMTEAPEGPRLTIVMGNAGAGKSVLFASLFSLLNRQFSAEKKAQRSASRPVLFLPEHIRDCSVATLDGLLEAVAATDAASATRPSLMRFLNRAGFTTWMFDGLDEFFAGETDFVEALAASLTPGSRAQTLICTRDSLLTSSSGLRDLIDRHIGDGRVRLYELARWQRPSQRALAFVRRVGRLPKPDEVGEPANVADFLAVLDRSEAAAELATLPFYCDLLLAEGAKEADSPKDELDLLARVVDGLIDREAGKLEGGELGFRWDVFSGAENFVEMAEMVEAWGADAFAGARDRERLQAALEAIGRDRLMELIEGIAHQMRMTVAYPNEVQGLATEDIEDLANFYLDVGVAPTLEPRVLLAVVQLAFFGPGDGEGQVRFAHEIVADYLAARHAMRMIRSHPESADAIGQALGVRRDLDRSIILRFLARELGEAPELAAVVMGHVEAGRIREAHADNARQLLAALATDEGVIWRQA